MDINKALEMEAKFSILLKKEFPNIYITLKSEKTGDYVLIVRQLKNIKP